MPYIIFPFSLISRSIGIFHYSSPLFYKLLYIILINSLFPSSIINISIFICICTFELLFIIISISICQLEWFLINPPFKAFVINWLSYDSIDFSKRSSCFQLFVSWIYYKIFSFYKKLRILFLFYEVYIVDNISIWFK